MNIRTTKTRESKRIRPIGFAALIAIGMIAASCKGTKPTNRVISLPVSTEDTSRESLSRYVETLENAPELLARERALLDRRMELRYNWSLNRALERGNVKVRAIAPPLQLTGDPTIDENRKHTILLVADDLRPGTTFLDEYEVRVGPDTLTAVVAPATSAASLERIDAEIAMENLRMVRADRALLSSGITTVSNFAAFAAPQIGQLLIASSNTLSEITNRAALANQRVTELRATIAEANTNIAAAKLQRNTSTNLGKEEIARLATTIREAELTKLDKAARIGEALKEQSELSNVEALYRQKIQAIQASTNNAAAMSAHAGLAVLEDFWAREADARRQLAQIKGSSGEYAMRSAVTITMRASSLRSIPQVTVDVIRRRGSADGTQNGAQSELSQRLRLSLKQAEGVFRNLRKLEILLHNKEFDRANVEASIDYHLATLSTVSGQIIGAASFFQPAKNEEAGRLKDMLAELSKLSTEAIRPLEEVQRAWDTSIRELKEAGKTLLDVRERTTTVSESSEIETLIRDMNNGTNTLTYLSLDIAAIQRALTNRALLSTNAEAFAMQLNSLTGRVQEARLKSEATIALLTNAVISLKGAATQKAAVTTNLNQRSNEIKGLNDKLEAARARIEEALEKFTVTKSTVTNLSMKTAAIQAAGPRKDTLQQELYSLLTNICEKAPLSIGSHFDRGETVSADHVKETLAAIDGRLHEIAKATSILESVDLEENAELNFFEKPKRNGTTTPAGAFLTDPEGTFAKIEQGDIAIFRFNVLRGVVSTTAFLLPEDGATKLFGRRFNDLFYVAQVTLRNPNDKPILVYGNTMRFVVRMTGGSPTELGEDGRPKRLNWWATFEPMDYDNVRRILEESNEKTWQKWLSKGIDFASMAGGIGSAFTTSLDFARGVGLFSGTFAPATKRLLEEDLLRFERNFREKGLNDIEEISAGGILTRYVFLPKGPIYGDFEYDPVAANALDGETESGFLRDEKSSRNFARKALRPSYIYSLRREEVYVEGKRILQSDPLSSTGIK